MSNSLAANREMLLAAIRAAFDKLHQGVCQLVESVRRFEDEGYVFEDEELREFGDMICDIRLIIGGQVDPQFADRYLFRKRGLFRTASVLPLSDQRAFAADWQFTIMLPNGDTLSPVASALTNKQVNQLIDRQRRSIRTAEEQRIWLAEKLRQNPAEESPPVDFKIATNGDLIVGNVRIGAATLERIVQKWQEKRKRVKKSLVPFV